MVNYYTEHVTNVAKIPSLNDDVIKEIMLNASMPTIKNLCLTNKAANQYCSSHRFWQEKFKHDHLPPLVVIKKHKDDKGIKLEIPSRMKRLPKTVKKWMEVYDKMLWCHQLASKLIDHIIATNIFNEFTANVDERRLLWLPISMVDYIKNDDQHVINIYFNIGKIFSLQMIVQDEESEDDENQGTDQTIEMSRQEITAYLTWLFYYEGHDPDFMLTSDGEEDAYDNLDKILGMNDFKKPDKHIKSYFPKW